MTPGQAFLTISKTAGQDFIDGDFTLAKARLSFLIEHTGKALAVQQLMAYCRQTRDPQTATEALSRLGGFANLQPNAQVECVLVLGQEPLRPAEVPTPAEFLSAYNEMPSVSEQDRRINSARLRCNSTNRLPQLIAEDATPDVTDLGQGFELLESLVYHFTRGPADLVEVLIQSSASGLLSTSRLRQFVDRISYFASPSELDVVLPAIHRYPLFPLISENVEKAHARVRVRGDRLMDSSVWKSNRDELLSNPSVSMMYVRHFLRLGDIETATEIFGAVTDMDHNHGESSLSRQIVHSMLELGRQLQPYEISDDHPPRARDLRAFFDVESNRPRTYSPIESRITDLLKSGDVEALSHLLRETESRRLLSPQKCLEFDHQLISVAGRNGDERTAFQHYDFLLANGLPIDDHIFAAAMRTASASGSITQVESIFSDFLERGLTINPHILSALIHCYANAENWPGVLKYLNWTIRADFIPHPRHHFGPAILCCRRLGNANNLALVLKMMAEHGVDLDVHNTADAMRTFIDARDSESALRLLRAHLRRHETMDSHLLQIGLEACRHTQNAEYAEQLLFILIQSGKQPDSHHFGSVIEVCGRNGLHDRACHWYREAQVVRGRDGYLIQRLAVSCEHAGDSEIFTSLIGEIEAEPQLLEAAGLASLLSCALSLGLPAQRQVLLDAADECLARVSSPPEVAEQFALDCARIGATEETLRFAAVAEVYGPISLRLKTTVAVSEARSGSSARLHELLSNGDTLRQVDEFALVGLVQTCADIGAYDLGRNLLQEMANRDSLSCRSLGYLLNSMVRNTDPRLVETTFRDFFPKAKRNDGDATVLFNIVLKAHSLYGSESDFNRIRLEMIAEGVELDRYFLGAIERRLGEAAIQGDERNPLRHSEANEWRMLAIMLDDVVHELSQMVGEIGLLARDISSSTPKIEDGHLRRTTTALLDVSRRLGERLQEYSAIAGGGTFSGMTRIGDTLEWLRDGFRLDWERLGIIGAISGDRDHKIAPLHVAISEFHLRLILKVLVKNAMDALTESRAAGRRNIWITAARSQNDRDLLLLVQDNGSGIPEDARQAIFDRGFSTKGGRGLGLGLSLVELVVETVGGRVHLENTSDTGTTFILTLPLKKDGDARSI